MRESSAIEIMNVDASSIIDFGDSFGPNVGGIMIPQSSGNMLYMGNFHKVPIAAGVNKDEGSMFTHHLGLETTEELEQMLDTYGLFKFRLQLSTHSIQSKRLEVHKLPWTSSTVT